MEIAIYSRKSVYTGKGESIENQIDLCKSYCERNFIDKEIKYTIYEDEGFSGKNVNRPKFQKLLNDIKTKNISILICYRLDRISRNVADFSSTLELLQKYNVNFISIKEQFDTITPMGRAMIYIASVFAQLERETIAERVKDNMLQLAKMGKWSGGQLPLGFNSEKIIYMNEKMKSKSFAKLAPTSEELDIVKFIYKNYLIKSSLLNTVNELTRLGYKTKTGTNFEITGVKRILKSPLYVQSDLSTHKYLRDNNYDVFGIPNGNGYLTYNKKSDKENLIVAVAAHKGIIPSFDWLCVQKKLDCNKKKYKFTSNRCGTGSNNALFSGILKCGKCNSNMVIKYNGINNKTGENYIYYVCGSNAKKTTDSKCDCPNLRSDLVDSIIIENIKLYSKEALLEIYKELLNSSNKKALTNLNLQLSKKELQVHNLIIQLSNSPNQDISNMIMNEINKINEDVSLIKQNLENINVEDKPFKESMDELNSIKDNIVKFNSYIDEAKDINVKRSLIKNILEKVTYDPHRNQFRIKFL